MTIYLFQVDSAKENRPFFEGMHSLMPGSVYFRGLDFSVGPWTPDGVRVDLEAGVSPPTCALILIELETARPTALKSSRKYLHENSTNICSEFKRYLNRVIEKCDSTADPREPQINLLMDVLTQHAMVTVKTAAALRSSTTFLEESPLTDQANLTQSHGALHNYTLHETSHHNIPTEGRIARKQPAVRGVCRLDPGQSKALRRCILILDSIVRHANQSSAIYNHWRVRPPLKRQLWQTAEKYPTLDLFILKQENSGITIDLDAVLAELVTIWAESGRQIDIEDVRNLIEDYFPIATKIRPNDEMHSIFEAAESQVGGKLPRFAV